MFVYSFYTDQLNSTIHGTMGKCPYELVFGQPPRQNLFPGVKGTRIMEEDVADILEDGDEHPERDSDLHHRPTSPVPSEKRDSDLHHRPTSPVPNKERDSNHRHSSLTSTLTQNPPPQMVICLEIPKSIWHYGKKLMIGIDGMQRACG